MASNPEPILVSIEDAAKIINCSRASVFNKINAGDIRAKKDGRRTLIPVSELKRYAESLPDLVVGNDVI